MTTFKLQRPLAGAMDLILIYNESRSIYFTMILSEEEIYRIFGDEVKIYVKGYIEANDTLVVSHIVEGQSLSW